MIFSVTSTNDIGVGLEALSALIIKMLFFLFALRLGYFCHTFFSSLPTTPMVTMIMTSGFFDNTLSLDTIPFFKFADILFPLAYLIYSCINDFLVAVKSGFAPISMKKFSFSSFGINLCKESSLFFCL